jgi:hypothetical protein
MTFQVADFTAAIQLEVGIHRWYSGIAADLNTIQTALAADTSTGDVCITSPPAALRIGPQNSRFYNDVLLAVNKGKGGNLTNTQMSNAISGGLSNFLVPVNTTPPVVSGTGTVGQTLTTTVGVWTNVPTSYSYQWLRDAALIPDAITPSHVCVAADSTHSLSCRVTGSNAAGAGASALSNAIAVT